MPWRRAVTLQRVALALYLLVLGWVVFAPGDDAERATGLVAVLARALEQFAVPFELGYPVLEFAANVALFAPFGLLLGLLAPAWPHWLVISAGFALSAAVELVQTQLPTRYATVSDVVANTLGTAVGLGLLHTTTRLRRTAAAA